jgi:hypothetical protein
LYGAVTCTALYGAVTCTALYGAVTCTALYGAVTCTLQEADEKHLESFKMWCWRRMEIALKIIHPPCAV